MLAFAGLLIGCNRGQPPVPQPPPIPQPGPGPTPQPPVPPGPDVEIDPNAPERLIGFNVTYPQMEKDIVGKWVTLNDNTRWSFKANDTLSLSPVSANPPTVMSKTEVVVLAQVKAVSGTNPNEKLSGFIKLRYEQVDGKWFMTEVIRLNADRFTVKK